jgi:hypothetical protein
VDNSVCLPDPHLSTLGALSVSGSSRHGGGWGVRWLDVATKLFCLFVCLFSPLCTYGLHLQGRRVSQTGRKHFTESFLFLNVRQVSRPYKTTDKIIMLDLAEVILAVTACITRIPSSMSICSFWLMTLSMLRPKTAIFRGRHVLMESFT